MKVSERFVALDDWALWNSCNGNPVGLICFLSPVEFDELLSVAGKMYLLWSFIFSTSPIEMQWGKEMGIFVRISNRFVRHPLECAENQVWSAWRACFTNSIYGIMLQNDSHILDLANLIPHKYTETNVFWSSEDQLCRMWAWKAPNVSHRSHQVSMEASCTSLLKVLLCSLIFEQ